MLNGGWEVVVVGWGEMGQFGPFEVIRDNVDHFEEKHLTILLKSNDLASLSNITFLHVFEQTF